MISFIETENFKRLGNFKATFTEGTNLVLGPNGGGKTTFFNAVRFALYGTGAIASSSENIPTWGENSCKVTLGVTGEFLVVRTLKDCKIYRADTSGHLQAVDELKVAEGNKACTEWVKEHLGLDHKMFSIFNMSMQGETGALITLGATELNRIVENFSGVGVLDTVIKSLSKENSHLEGALGTVEYVDVSEQEAEWESNQKPLENAEIDKNMRQGKLEEAKLAETQAATLYQEETKHNSKVAAMKQTQASAQGKVELLVPQLKEATEQVASLQTQADAVNLQDIESKHLKLDKEVKIFNQDSTLHSSCEGQLPQLIADHATYVENSKKEKDVARQRSELESSLESLTEARDSLTDKGFELKQAAKNLEEKLHNGACALCKRDFEGFDEVAVTEEYNAAVDQLNAHRSKYEEANDEVHTVKVSLSKLPDYGKDNAAKAVQVQSRIATLRADIDALELRWENFDEDSVIEKMKKLNKSFSDGKNILSQLQQAKVLQSTATDSLSKAKVSLESLGEIPKTYDTENSERVWKLATKAKSLLEEEVKALSETYQVQLSESRSLRARIDSLISINKSYEQYSVKIDKVKRLMKFLRDSRTKYMDGVWSMVLGAATGWINTTTGGWITAVGRNKKGDFTFTENGISAPVYSEASGAQKEFIGVSLRIGLGMALQGANSMLLLDEPTAGMREENADKLATGLLGVAGQKIIITHRQSERLTAANVVNV